MTRVRGRIASPALPRLEFPKHAIEFAVILELDSGGGGPGMLA